LISGQTAAGNDFTHVDRIIVNPCIFFDLHINIDNIKRFSPNVLFEALANETNPWEASYEVGVDITDLPAMQSMLGLNQTEEAPSADFFNEPTSAAGAQLFNFNIISLPVCWFLPASLDLRNKHPKCASLRYIRNQGGCGSCWAFASMNSLSDRYCIKYSNSLGIAERWFAAQDPLECGTPAQGIWGCGGGMLYSGYMFAQANGAVTGEDPGNDYLCKPYRFVDSPCSSSCANSANFHNTYANDKYHVSSYKQITGATLSDVVRNMKCALNQNGTIIVRIHIYQDFYLYKGPKVYYHVSGSYVGDHAVRVIGYGTYCGVPYWLIANSWGTGYGQAGYYKIRRGNNEIGIESDVWEAFF
jgi:cathepsin B